jgi:membrane-associated phospholipid phosphatase
MTAWLVLLLDASLTASPYHVDYVSDGVATGATFALLAISEAIVKPTLEGGVHCRSLRPDGSCDPSRLNALDRTVVGNDSDAWALVSNVGVGVAYGLPLLAEALDVASSDSATKGADFTADALVMAESVAVATGGANVIKYAVRRPRPAQYREGASGGSLESQLSFPSGHTTSAAAATSAYATTFWLRHPDSPWRFAVIGGAAAITGVTGYGRIGGGWHFYTDVAAGAILGGAVGTVLPLLHRRNLSMAMQPTAAAGGRGAGAIVSLQGLL